MKRDKVRGLSIVYRCACPVVLLTIGCMLAIADQRVAYAQERRSGASGDVAPSELAQVGNRSADTQDGPPGGEGYVARDAALDQVFEALATELGKPIVPSAKARRKKVSGEFDLSRPHSVLERVCADLGLVAYFDGRVIYVYDVSELTNAMGSLSSIDVGTLIAFLRESGLYADRFPINGNAHAHTFYVAGPPVYVDAVLAAARHLDAGERKATAAGEDIVKVIALKHTFVRDRTFKLRDQEIRVPGVATVLAEMLGQRAAVAEVLPRNNERLADTALSSLPGTSKWNGISARDETASSVPPIPVAPLDDRAMGKLPGQVIQAGSQPSVLAYPDTNSLLLKGGREEVQYLTELVRQLDTEKTQIELSLWIIDLSYRSLEQLGVRWQGAAHVNGLGATFNAAPERLSGALSTLDGARFLASVFAMSQKGNAEVVSRPLILTQENVPAIFDNNRTFYAKLIGERTSSLDRITYGTLVSVLPRLSADHAEIEMILDIEDGDTESIDGREFEVDGLPIVGRMHISTIARVPRELSLLIGGYTRHLQDGQLNKIPLLGDLPLVGNLFRYRESSQEDVVRVFLIQPRVLPQRAVWDGEGFREVPRLTSSLTIDEGTTLLGEAMRREQPDAMPDVSPATPSSAPAGGSGAP